MTFPAFKSNWPGGTSNAAIRTWYRNALGCYGLGILTVRNSLATMAGVDLRQYNATIFRRHTRDKDTRQQVDNGVAYWQGLGDRFGFTRIYIVNDESGVPLSETQAEIAHIKDIDPEALAAWVNPWLSAAWGHVDPAMVADRDVTIFYLRTEGINRTPEIGAWAMARARELGLPIIAGIQPVTSGGNPVDPTGYHTALSTMADADALVAWGADDWYTRCMEGNAKALANAQAFRDVILRPSTRPTKAIARRDYASEWRDCTAAWRAGYRPVFE